MMTGNRDHPPPRLALAVLKRFCDTAFYEEFIGDLEELHTERARRSHIVADLLFWIDVGSFLRQRFRSRQTQSNTSNRPIMFGHYLHVAWRGFTRNRGYAVVNVVGLATGLACCLLITLFIQHELSFDRFHEHGDRIYRVVSEENDTGRLAKRASTHMPLAPTLAREFAAVEQQTRVYPYPALLVNEAGRKFQEDGLMMVDSTFLEIFSFGMIQGDPTTALDDPFSLVVTTTMANRLFGRADRLARSFRCEPVGAPSTSP